MRGEKIKIIKNTEKITAKAFKSIRVLKKLKLMKLFKLICHYKWRQASLNVNIKVKNRVRVEGSLVKEKESVGKWEEERGEK